MPGAPGSGACPLPSQNRLATRHCVGKTAQHQSHICPETTESLRSRLPARRLRRPLDLGATDDRLLAAVPKDDPGLIAAVVIGRPKPQRRLPAPDRAGLLAGFFQPAPDADEGV